MSNEIFTAGAECDRLNRLAPQIAAALRDYDPSKVWSAEPAFQMPRGGVAAIIASAELRLKISHDWSLKVIRGRWVIEGDYMELTGFAVRPDAGWPKVTAAQSRSAGEIAAQIHRHLLAPVYWVVDPARKRKEAAEVNKARARAIHAQMLEAGRGWFVEYCNATCPQLRTDVHRCGFEINACCSCEGVAFDQNSGHFPHQPLPVELAEQIILTIANYCDMRQELRGGR